MNQLFYCSNSIFMTNFKYSKLFNYFKHFKNKKYLSLNYLIIIRRVQGGVQTEIGPWVREHTIGGGYCACHRLGSAYFPHVAFFKLLVTLIFLLDELALLLPPIVKIFLQLHLRTLHQMLRMFDLSFQVFELLKIKSIALNWKKWFIVYEFK